MYLKCRCRKRGKLSALAFESDFESLLVDLYEALVNQDYQPKAARLFIVAQPKYREIIAADFSDRIIHHLIVNYLEKIYEPTFIYDSYACRQNKGVHAAVNRVQYFMRRLTSEHKGVNAYYLHMDIKQFFLNIDKRILLTLLRYKLHKALKNSSWELSYQDTALLYNLIKIVLYANQYHIVETERNIKRYKRMPEHKSLAKTNKSHIGLPIGNLTSQFFANVYLNELDHYVKHVLKCRSYIRYCDDFIILEPSETRLYEIKHHITCFLYEKLKLESNARYGNVAPISNGIDCLGYIVHFNYKLIRKRTVHHFEHRLLYYKKQLESKGTDVIKMLKNLRLMRTDIQLCDKAVSAYLYPMFLLTKLHSVISSYLGMFKHADTYRLKQSIFDNYSYLYHYFDKAILEDTYFTKLKALFKYKKEFKSIYHQHFYFKKCFQNTLLLFQVGKFYHFYDKLSIKMENILNLERVSSKGITARFCQFLLHENIQQLLIHAIDFVIIKELPACYSHIKVRMPLIYIKNMRSPQIKST